MIDDSPRIKDETKEKKANAPVTPKKVDGSLSGSENFTVCRSSQVRILRYRDNLFKALRIVLGSTCCTLAKNIVWRTCTKVFTQFGANEHLAQVY